MKTKSEPQIKIRRFKSCTPQIQDDFLDCFGNPEVTGKVGTDIKDNKCTWLAVLCMQRATPEQKKIMKDCYGSSGELDDFCHFPICKQRLM